MELDDNPSHIVHRAPADAKTNYWVIGLVVVLWILSLALYTPGMP